MTKKELLEIIRECEYGTEGICPVCLEVLNESCEYTHKDEYGFNIGHALNCRLAKALNEEK